MVDKIVNYASLMFVVPPRFTNTMILVPAAAVSVMLFAAVANVRFWTARRATYATDPAPVAYIIYSPTLFEFESQTQNNPR